MLDWLARNTDLVALFLGHLSGHHDPFHSPVGSVFSPRPDSRKPGRADRPVDPRRPAADGLAVRIGVVDAVSDMAIRKAREHQPGRDNLSWGKYLQAAVTKRALGDLAK